MSDKQLPTPVVATTKLLADLDQIVASVGKKKSGWRRSGLRDADLQETSANPGVYLFLMPTRALPKARTLVLHGRTFGRRQSRRQLQIQFRYKPQRLGKSDDMVVYVGKAANLRARIKAHLSIDPKATTNQVLRGLVATPHTHVTRPALEVAKHTLQARGSFYFREHFHPDEAMDCRTHDHVGECLVAERDLLEIKLIAAHAPPFNIKAER